MLPFFFLTLTLILFFIVEKKEITLSLRKIVIIAIALRILIIFLFISNKSQDIVSFVDSGEIILKKTQVYPFYYFPFITYLSALVVYVKDIVNPFLFLKLIFGIFDVLVLFPLYQISKKNLQTILLYALNPITLIVGGIHGQMDAIPMFLFLTAINLFIRGKLLSSSLTLSFGIFTKSWPFLFFLPILKRSKNKWVFITIVVFPVVFVLLHAFFFNIPIVDILALVKRNRGVFGVWGIGQIIYFLWPNFDFLWSKYIIVIFLMSFFLFSFFYRNKKLIKEILVVMLFFFSFSPTFGTQWLFWLVPFVLLEKPHNWKTFFLIAFLYLVVAFAWDYSIPGQYQTIISKLPVASMLGLIVWGVTVRMFTRLMSIF